MPVRKILILFAHPSLERSEVNAPLADAVSGLPGVNLVDLYAEYPDFQVDIDREQQRLLDHDVIIFQHPLYWYSTPAILKEWQDLVLEHNFAYGTKGDKLHGKIFFSAITAGGGEDAYRSGGYNNFTIRELLHPMEQTANLCGMIYLPPYALFGSRSAVDEDRVHCHIDGWKKILQALRDDQLDITRAQQLDCLNNHIEDVITAAHGKEAD